MLFDENKIKKLEEYKRLEGLYETCQEHKESLETFAENMQSVQEERGIPITVEDLALMPYAFDKPLNPEDLEKFYKLIDERRYEELKLLTNCHKTVKVEYIEAKNDMKPAFEALFDKIFTGSPPTVVGVAYRLFEIYLDNKVNLENNLRYVKSAIIENLKNAQMPYGAVKTSEALSKLDKGESSKK